MKLTDEPTTSNGAYERLVRYPLLSALIERRPRRFAGDMSLNSDPLAYDSTRAPQPLSLEKEAALAFAIIDQNVGASTTGDGKVG